MNRLTASSILSVLESQCEVPIGSRLLVTVSGGLDSMVLLYLLNKCDFKVEVAHCNFSLRDDESDNDASFVQQQCQAYGLKLHTIQFNTQDYASENGISIEMAARDLRYEWFNQLMDLHRLDFIVTGHHGDDAIETFFLNLVRGTGVKGLSGMHFRNNKVVRPLLGYSRSDLDAFANKNQIEYRVDSSNADTVYYRNKIRHDILPALKGLNPSFFQTMQHNMAHLKELELLLESEVQKTIKSIVVEEEGRYLISISHLVNHPQKMAVMHELLKDYGFSSTVVKDVVDSLTSQSGKQFFSQSHRLIKDRHNLLLMQRVDEAVDYFWMDVNESDESRFALQVFDKPVDFEYSTNAKIAHFDADLVDLPLLVRRWKQGDVFKPLGMKGFKKVSDFFIDKKYSLLQKEEAWIVVSGENIVWIAGDRVDDRVKVTARTKNILEIKKA